MTIEQDPNSSGSATPLMTPAVTSFVGASEAVAPVGGPSPIRKFLNSRGSGDVADKVFIGVMLVCALSIFGIVLFILTILILRSRLTLHQFGFSFFLHSAWDPVSGDFGALPFIVGTLETSLLALAMAVPLSMGVAIFLSELCPEKLRAPISFVTELLAAIPSVVYGLWAVFVLVPLMRDHLGDILYKYLGWTHLFEGYNFGVGLLTASIILARPTASPPCAASAAWTTNGCCVEGRESSRRHSASPKTQRPAARRAAAQLACTSANTRHRHRFADRPHQGGGPALALRLERLEVPEQAVSASVEVMTLDLPWLMNACGG